MALRDLLFERKAALCERWLDAVLAEYGQLTAVRWRRERDPFANPVGHALATGLTEILGAIASEGEPEAGARAALEAIVRIRSVQGMTPSRAVGFVGKLRGVVRAELAAEIAGGALDAELAEVDGRIERLVLLAFDTYVGIREQVFRIRQEELKRSVGSLLRRWYGGVLPEAPAEEVVQLSPPSGRDLQR
jgi:hypothetical protein